MHAICSHCVLVVFFADIPSGVNVIADLVENLDEDAGVGSPGDVRGSLRCSRRGGAQRSFRAERPVCWGETWSAQSRSAGARRTALWTRAAWTQAAFL